MPGSTWRRLRHIAKRGFRSRLRQLVLSRGDEDMFVVREDLARRYLAGSGIEIGPSVWPLRVPTGVHVRYVDYLSRADLVRVYGASLVRDGLDPSSIPETDVIDDAARLQRFADGSVDFVVANHVLEHVEDPIGALQNLLRVLRTGGILFVTLPDPRRSFDALRPRTTIEHLLRDHREGPQQSRAEHYQEWARLIERVADEDVERRVEHFAQQEARNHFHVWELDDFLALLRAVDLPCALELARISEPEFAVILRKTRAGAPTAAPAHP